MELEIPPHQPNRETLLRELMQNYGQDVWNFAFSITRRTDLADDISQEVFIKVFQKLNTFRGDSSVKTWLLSITRNVALDTLRSAFLRKVTLVGYLLERGTHPAAEKEALESLEVEDAWRYVLRLPSKPREALVLFAHNHLTIPEIADLLGISEGTVKTRIHRAREKVAQLIKEDESNEHKGTLGNANI